MIDNRPVTECFPMHVSCDLYRKQDFSIYEAKNSSSCHYGGDLTCEIPGHLPWDHFVAVNKMVDHCIKNPIFQNYSMLGLDFRSVAADNSKYIRPLAVRPLNNPEGVPTPWGFSVSGPSASMVGGQY